MIDVCATTGFRCRPILLIDSDPRALIASRRSLAAQGLMNPTIELSGGDEAIAELSRCVDGGPDCIPVLVLLDRQLAGTSGIDVVRWMRRTPALAAVPVVVVSAQCDAAGVTEMYELGVSSYLIKPVAFESLGAIVRSLPMPWMFS